MEQAPEVERGPERVIGPGVGELVLVQREVLAGEMADDVTERQVVEPGAQLVHPTLDRFRRDVVDDRLVGRLVEHDRTEVPRDDHLERQRVARVPRELAHRRRQRDRHRLQVRRSGRRQRPLREAHVARAVAPEPAVEPRLLGDPVGGGAAVGRLGEVAVRTLRAVGAATRLEHVPVAACRELRARTRGDALAPVGRAFEQRRRIVDADRVVHVGEQHDAVGHLDLHVAFDLDLVAPWAHPCSVARGVQQRPADPATLLRHGPRTERCKGRHRRRHERDGSGRSGVLRCRRRRRRGAGASPGPARRRARVVAARSGAPTRSPSRPI